MNSIQFSQNGFSREKVAIAIGIAIAIDCEIGRGRHDSDSDPDSDPDRELFFGDLSFFQFRSQAPPGNAYVRLCLRSCGVKLMLLKITTLRFSPTLEQFDDTDLMDFVKDKEVLSARNYFFIKNETPYLTVVLHYLKDHNPSAASGKSIKKDETWREIIKDDELPLYNALRSWRAERAKREGIAPYIICNNAELAQVVAARPKWRNTERPFQFHSQAPPGNACVEAPPRLGFRSCAPYPHRFHSHACVFPAGGMPWQGTQLRL